jgi:transglutaminase-like putative cysteine protease
MRYAVVHRTEYAYVQPVTLALHAARLTPRHTDRQRRASIDWRIRPQPAQKTERPDYFGNTVTAFVIHETHEKLVVEVASEMEIEAVLPPDPHRTPPWEVVRDILAEPLSEEELAASEYLHDSPLVKASTETLALAKSCFPPGRPIVEAVLDLSRRIHKEFTFDPRATTLSTPLGTVIKHKRGVCQDFAHLAIACLRSLGLAARYISGYLRTTPPPGMPRLTGSDASHAWFASWVPGAGWVDADPTNNCIPAEGHITTAWGRDYSDVSPLRGVLTGGGPHALAVSVEVEPLELKEKAAAQVRLKE